MKTLFLLGFQLKEVKTFHKLFKGYTVFRRDKGGRVLVLKGKVFILQVLSFKMQEFYLNLSSGQKARFVRWKIPSLLPRLRGCFSSVRFVYLREQEDSPFSKAKPFSHRIPYFFIGTRVCFPLYLGPGLLGFVVASMIVNFRQVEQIRESIDTHLGPWKKAAGEVVVF